MRGKEYELLTTSNPFFRMQELMFLPRENGEEKTEKYIQKVKNEVKILKKYCINYMQKSPNGSRLITPRGYRIHNEYVLANLEPVLARAAFIASNCNSSTVGRYYYIIQEYYNNLSKPYVSAEMMQALVGRMVSGGNNWMSYEQEPIYFFNKKRGVIGSYDEEYYGLNRTEYEKIEGQLNANISDSECVYLKIGRFSTKEDVKWFVDNYWEKMTKDMPNTKRNDFRMTEKKLRTLLTDCMLTCGLRTGDIISIIDDVFPVLDNVYTDAHPGDVKKGTIDKARKDLKKRLSKDAFNTAYDDLIRLSHRQKLAADPSNSERNLFLTTDSELEDNEIKEPLVFRVTNTLSDKTRLEITESIKICKASDPDDTAIIENKI